MIKSINLTNFRFDNTKREVCRREDSPRRASPKCKSGKPCGDRCIPRNHKCKDSAKTGVIGWTTEEKIRAVKTGLHLTGLAIMAGAIAHDGHNLYQSVKHASDANKYNEWVREYQKKAEKGETHDPPEDFFSDKFNNFYKQNTGRDFKDDWENTKKQNKGYQGADTKTSSGKEYWEVLGVGKDATPEEIKKAYKQKMRENHPDLGGDKEASQKINEAYDVFEKHQEFKSKNRKDSYKNSYVEEIYQAYKKAQSQHPRVDSRYWDNFDDTAYMFKYTNNYTSPLAFSKYV